MTSQWRFKGSEPRDEWSEWRDIASGGAEILAVAIDFREKPKQLPGWYWATQDASGNYIQHASRAVEWYTELDLQYNEATLEQVATPKVILS
jgi:hypothetical protein